VSTVVDGWSGMKFTRITSTSLLVQAPAPIWALVPVSVPVLLVLLVLALLVVDRKEVAVADNLLLYLFLCFLMYCLYHSRIDINSYVSVSQQYSNN
jgi:hypothetical protein